MWYLVSFAIRSPPSIQDRRMVSWSSVIMVRIFVSASNVRAWWSSPSSSPFDKTSNIQINYLLFTSSSFIPMLINAGFSFHCPCTSSGNFMPRCTVCWKTSRILIFKIDIHWKCSNGLKLFYIGQKRSINFWFIFTCSWTLQWGFQRLNSFLLTNNTLFPV